MRKWQPAPPYPGRGPISRRVTFNTAAPLDPEEAARRTQKSKIYWTAYRAGQLAARDAGFVRPNLGRVNPSRPRKRRQWMPGEHKPKKTTAKGTKSQGELFSKK